ncbi:prepilin peptidase [Couchioplanes azureus]|uniref:prepilin peptidase n=1 Tax=Couchioplanes caeruleus TaxID=56438 RepID=UPI0016705903|nr:prepilin peptidase [Couchioplanes caeruleus]GGQ42999.1 hypothetical protein GCM10010166_09040 [Couchioplanes caeruleus subsp. azureus]
MNALAASGIAVAGALAGVPIAAIAYSAPERGSVRVPERWWRGAPARPTTVAVVSALTGAAAGLVAVCLPLSLTLPAFWTFAVLGVGLAITDLRRHRLPYALTGTLAAACTICFTLPVVMGGSSVPVLRALTAGSVTVVALLILALSLPGQLGLGDVALAGVVALSLGWLSWQAAAAGVLGAFLIQPAVVLVSKLRGAGRVTPMGPAFLVAWLGSVVAHGM